MTILSVPLGIQCESSESILSSKGFQRELVPTLHISCEFFFPSKEDNLILILLKSMKIAINYRKRKLLHQKKPLCSVLLIKEHKCLSYDQWNYIYNYKIEGFIPFTTSGMSTTCKLTSPWGRIRQTEYTCMPHHQQRPWVGLLRWTYIYK